MLATLTAFVRLVRWKVLYLAPTFCLFSTLCFKQIEVIGLDGYIWILTSLPSFWQIMPLLEIAGVVLLGFMPKRGDLLSPSLQYR
jgi:hypothetical protein